MKAVVTTVKSGLFLCFVMILFAPLASKAQAPSISSQPTNDSVCQGSAAYFLITASNTNSYQWQVNAGSGWSNLSNSGGYGGTTTDSLYITSVATSMDGYQYRCIATGSTSPAATSNIATLYVSGINSTTNDTVCAGGTGQLTASATNITSLVNWYTVSSGGSPVDTGSTLTINSATTTTTYYAEAAGPGSSTGTDSLATAYNQNNGQRGAMFDVQTGSNPITVTGFDANLYASTTAYYELYYRTSTHVGHQNSSTGWVFLDSASNVTSLGNNVPTPLPFTFSVTIPANTRYSFYLTNSFGGGLNYTDGTSVGNTLASNSDVTIYEGVGKSYPFGLTFTVRNVNATMHYTIGTGSCTSSSRVAATLTVNPQASVTAQPTNSNITSGNNTSFSITASNANSYQWQVNNGSGWSNISNTGIYSGATTGTLSLTAANNTYNSYQYRCIISNSGNCADTSNSATLSVSGSAPSISSHPSNSTICEGDNTSFSVTASGTSLTYQWQVSNNGGSTYSNVSNGAVYSGTTTSTLSITNAATIMSTFRFRCIVSGAVSPAATSNAGILTVNPAPAITSNPSNSSICSGTNTSFSVTATNATSYQWQVSSNGGSTYANVSNSAVYSGTTTSTLSISNATVSMNTYRFRCVVSGSCTPNATSAAAVITVNASAVIISQPSNSTITTGSNTSFSVTASNANNYQWQVNSGSGWSNVNNTGIYNGATTNTLSLTSVSNTYNGYSYRCIANNSNTCPDTSNVVSLSVSGSAPSISSHPANSTICEGNSTTFSVTASGTSLTYQWQVNTGSGWNNLSNTGIYSGATGATLSLSSVANSYSTYQYRCVVSGAVSPAATSNVATLTVNTAPAITTQPTNSTITSGNNTSFTVAATGSGLTYQWQTNNGSGWGNVTNTGIYSGATTNTLTLTGATASVNGDQYRCVVSGTCTPSVTSNIATLTVNTSANITSHPTNSTVCVGNNTSFTVTSTTAVSYQWEVNSGSGWSNVTNTGIYSGATTTTLTLTNVASANSGNQYRCVVTGSAPPPATSNTATLTVNTAPSITAQPSNRTICDGSNSSFSISATGSGLTYQWQVNSGSGWSNIANTGIYSGATSNTLSLTAAPIAVNGNQYRCVVSGSCSPSATSNTGILTINALPTITGQPSNSTICDGDNTSFTITATGAGVTYQWQVNSGSGWSNIANAGIYSGATTNSLSLTAATSTVDGNQYRCVVSGTCNPDATSGSATLNINTAPAVTLQPSNSTVCDGSNTSFGITATGSGLTYQWQVNSGSGWSNVSNTGIYNGATTNTLSLSSVTGVSNGDQFRCIVSGSCTPSATSNAAILSINSLLSVSTHPMNSTICSGNNTYFAVAASASGLTYQWQVNSGSGWSNVANTGIYSGATTDTLKLTAATTSVTGNQYRCVLNSTCAAPVNSNAAALTVNVAPNITSQPSASIICAGNNTSFSISATGSSLTYQWEVNSGSGWTNVTNNTIYAGATTNTLNLSTPAVVLSGNQYRCVVGGVCVPGVNSNAVTLTINEAPSLSAQPTNSTICAGNNTYFSVVASGTSLSYQWQVNTGSGWSNIANTGIYSGATNDTLTLTAATIAMNGNQYRCVVSGVCTPDVTSNMAMITVNAAPAIATQPSASTICAGNSTSFSVSATGSSITYQWEVNSGSGWTNVTNNTTYAGATTNTLNLSTPATALSGNQYRCTIGGVCVPGVNSNAVSLTVNTLPSLSAQPTNSTICAGNNTYFAVAASGTGLTYQWQVNSGSGWSNVANAGIYSGATTDTLLLTAATTAVNGNQYRCIVSGVCAPAVTSSTVSLVVNSAPSIATHPVNSTICEGSNTSFSISASGTSLTYQWEVNDGSGWANVNNSSVYTGATTSTLSLTSPQASYTTYQYRCVVGGVCVPGLTSNTASLTINTAPVIIVQASNSTICSGDNTYFAVAATGTSLTYQWQVNSGSGWTNVTNTSFYGGATTDSLILTAASASLDGNQYRCQVSGVCSPNVISSTVSLTVNTAPVITQQPTNSTICEGSGTSFNVSATGTGLTYQWQVNAGNGWSNVTNAGIYTGATTNTLSLSGATAAVHNYQYRCEVGGTCVPGVISNSVTLIINTAPVVTTQPVNSTICSGVNTSFSVAATGTGLAYQWQINTGSGWSNIINTGIYSGATTNVLSLIGATTSSNSDQFRCVVSGTCSPVETSNIASLTVNGLPAITNQPASSTICDGSSAGFTVAATGAGLNYQWQVNSGSGWNNLSNAGIYSGASTNALVLTGATTSANGFQYRCVVSGTCTPSVISNAVSLTVNTPPVITSQPSAQTICEGLNHTFSIAATGSSLTYQWQVNSGSGWANLTNAGVYTGANTNALMLNNIPANYTNYQYRCVVSGVCPPDVTSNAVTLIVQTNAVVTTQPQSSITICSGDTTGYTVNATGTGLSYQWWVYNGSNWSALSNSTVYSGVTSKTLNISGLGAPTSALTYQYYCHVSGTCSNVNSDTSVLTINARPAITLQPNNDAVCDSTTNVTFSTNATGTGIAYQWQLNTGSGWSNINNNSNYSGATTKTLTINQAYYSMHGNYFRCVVSGTCSPDAITNGVVLTVYPLKTPYFSISASNDDICVGTSVTFTPAPVNGGSSPSYVWKLNGNNVATGNTYTTGTLADNDVIECEMTSSYICPTPKVVSSNNSVVMKVTPYSTPTITISSPTGNQGCLGRNMFFYAQTTNGGPTPTFDWNVNGNSVGANVDSFTSNMLQNGDVINCDMTSSIKCPSPETVTSNSMTLDIMKVTKAAIDIAAADTVICDGEEVSLISWFRNGGASPAFQWLVNGQDVAGATQGTFKSTALRDGDIIECRFTSSARCVFPEVSNEVRFDVNKVVKTFVGIEFYQSGEYSYTFLARPSNGGAEPKYQWFKNNRPVPGATDSIYVVNDPSLYDRISVQLVSSLECVEERSVMSRSLTTSIDEQDRNLGLSLYPNPNSGVFTVRAKTNVKTTTTVELQIVNAVGQIVYKEQVEMKQGEIKHSINASDDLAAGAYMLLLSVEEHDLYKRFVIID